MSDDIVTRLETLAGNYKTSDFEFMYADYETVCEASAEIERLRKELQHSALQTNLMRNIAYAPYGDAADEIERLRNEVDQWRFTCAKLTEIVQRDLNR